MKTTLKYIWIVTALLIFSCSKDDDPKAPAALSSVSPTNGPKTTIVTLNGSNFGTDPSQVQVYFNGKEGSIISVNENQIKATVPPRAYTGTITLKVRGTTFTGPDFGYLITDVQVSTLAGSTIGFADGVGSTAKFDDVGDVVLDKDGNVYATDIDNHNIRKITPAGVVTTVAGGVLGYADGSGTTAKFSSPYSIAIDLEGNLYVADAANHNIRKITPSGVVSTLAGSTAGFADGTGTAAKFYTPTGITADSDGNIYVADFNNQRIRKITPSGTVSTLAGSTIGSADGNGSSAQFEYPYDVAIDSEGNLFVMEPYISRVRKITPSGQVTTIAQIGSNGYGIAVDGHGDIYATSGNGLKIYKINAEGTETLFVGNVAGDVDGSGDVARFMALKGLTIDSEMNVYVADKYKIRKITQE